jgi:hypothetical protein
VGVLGPKLALRVSGSVLNSSESRPYRLVGTMAMRASLLASLPVPQGVGQEEQVPDAVSEERNGYQIA